MPEFDDTFKTLIACSAAIGCMSWFTMMALGGSLYAAHMLGANIPGLAHLERQRIDDKQTLR